MTRKNGYRYFLSRFFFQIIGSWAIAPIGFLVAQALGQGANKYLYLYLIIASLSTGCGLFLNEILAPQNARLKRRSAWTTKSELACFSVMALLLFFYFIVLAEGSGAKVPTLAMVFLVFSSLVASWLSYSTSSLFCQALANESHKLPKRICLALGLLPPLVSQLFVVLISLAGSDISVPIGSILVGLTIFAPSSIQYLFAMSSLRGRSLGFSPAGMATITPFRYELFAILTTVLSISMATTLLKSHIAGSASSYSNLAFLALNITGTIAMVFAKSSFLIGSIEGSSPDGTLRLLGYITSASLSILALGAHLLFPGLFGQFIASFVLIILLSICMQLLLRSARTLSLL
jgi:hypothetical protein